LNLKLLIALGNPGQRYETTRHNAGFWVLDGLARDHGVSWPHAQDQKFLGDVTKGVICGESCILLKPMTFMNLSGRSVLKVAQFYKIHHEEWIVFQDDIDLASRKVKARRGGGHGGHNGIRSIIEETGTDEFYRIKLGVGRPDVLSDGKSTLGVADFVLQPQSESMVREFVEAVR
jgi:peptidyl-tRNA hydrolase, PTH1 family